MAGAHIDREVLRNTLKQPLGTGLLRRIEF